MGLDQGFRLVLEPLVAGALLDIVRPPLRRINKPVVEADDRAAGAVTFVGSFGQSVSELAFALAFAFVFARAGLFGFPVRLLLGTLLVFRQRLPLPRGGPSSLNALAGLLRGGPPSLTVGGAVGVLLRVFLGLLHPSEHFGSLLSSLFGSCVGGVCALFALHFVLFRNGVVHLVHPGRSLAHDPVLDAHHQHRA